MNHRINIDATLLSSSTITIVECGTRDARVVQLIELEPGTYRIQTHQISGADCAFEVTDQGVVSYPTELEVLQGGYLGGRGTTTLRISGFPVTLDGTQLATDKCALAGITDWLPKTSTHLLRLLPGRYDFIQPNGPVPEADLQVRTDGTVDYPSTSDSFLSGRGSAAFVIAGFPVTLDGTQLATDKCALAGITDWLPKTSTHLLRLLPGRYGFIQPNGPVPEADLQIRTDGTVDYPSTSDSFLSGRGSAAFVIAGFPVTLDGTQLATDKCALAGITDWLPKTSTHLLRLLPGRYGFIQPNGPVPEADLQIRTDGTVDYPSTSDSFLSGRGSAAFVIAGFPVTLDGTQLATDKCALAGITDWLPKTSTHLLRLLPGRYGFIQPNGPVPEADLQIRTDGTVDYPSTSDSFLSGRGSAAFVIAGFPVTLDGTQLATDKCALAGITDWLPKTSTHLLRLLPGRYGFIQPNGPVPEADLQVRTDGTVDYPSTSDSFLSGRGSAAFVIAGFPVTLDGTQLATDKCALAGITDWLPKTSTHLLRLLPGRYRFIQPNGAIPEADFQVRIDGRVDYAEVQDVTAEPPGVLSGRNSHTIQLVGYQVLVDTSNIVGAAVFLMPYAIDISALAGLPHVVALLPSSGLSLELRGVPPRVALFDLASGGRVLLDEPYPFVDLRWKESKQLLTLSFDVIRKKLPCCADFAIATP